MAQCFLCDTEAPREHKGDRHRCDCRTCGTYFISDTALELLKNKTIPLEERYKLSGITRRAAEVGNRVTLLSTTIADTLATATVPRTLLDALNDLLLLIHRRQPTLTQPTNLTERDYPLIFARSADELEAFLGHLRDQGYISLEDFGDGWLATLTFGGWRRLEEIQTQGRASNQVFVAMWFDDSMKAAWTDGFEPALTEAGYTPIKIDLLQYNGKVDDKILVEIRRSGFLVADTTGNRGGVYFEAGFALGLGLPVIWCVKEAEIKNVHFDTRQYNHVTWSEPAELKEKLYNRVVASMGRPLTQG